MTKAATKIRRQPKYKAIRTEYGGRWYASKAEAARAAELDLLLRAGKIAWWLPQVPICLGLPENRYVVDFLVAESDGGGNSVTVHAEDVKGTETAKFRRDVKLWLAYAPFPLWIIKRGKVREIIPGQETL